MLPWLRRGGGGTIVNVCSINVHGGSPQLTAYVGAKAALAAMTKNIAAAVARDRVRVNGLNLGWTLTPNEHLVQTECTGSQRIGPRHWGGRSRSGGCWRLRMPRAPSRFWPRTSSADDGALVDYAQQVIGTYPAIEP